ncbi:MAG TPA: glucose-6-phosphate dehydrogenase [Steroidobacteraceae bacterium]
MTKHSIQKFVLFGATGDLSQRMVWPSLYHLCREKLVAPTLTFVGSARNAMPNEEFRKFVEGALRKHVLPEYLKEDALADLLTRITYAPFQAGDGSAAGTEPLQKALAGSNRILYFMATSPKFYGPTARSLAAAGLACELCRIILEKPIGTDFASSVAINEAVGSVFHEDRIFRIDHYLGKEAVQNLLALRFANSLFEPLWNSSSIDNVQITVAETVGLEGRTGYYDEAGALRDMIQNHVLQLMALVAMEPPHLFEPNEVRNEKTKVIRSLRPITAATVGATTVRGQYAAGSAGGVAVPGYNQEQGAKGDSETETFVALRAEIDNWRWAGVPFYLRTGKRMQSRRTDIAIQFKTVPHNIFAADEPTLQANRLVIKLQPQESVVLQILSKQPAIEGVRLREVPLELSLPKDESGGRTRIAYERLLLDALKGNTTLFVRRDEVEAAWHWIDGIQTSWKATRQLVKPYPAGTWGPTAAIALTERHGHSWYE